MIDLIVNTHLYVAEPYSYTIMYMYAADHEYNSNDGMNHITAHYLVHS